MPRFSELKTDAERLVFVKEKLATDDRWIARGIIALFAQQTPREKKSKAAIKNNGRGFSSYDAETLTKIAKILVNSEAQTECRTLKRPFELSKYLSNNLQKEARWRMPKYAKQLLDLSLNRKYPD